MTKHDEQPRSERRAGTGGLVAGVVELATETDGEPRYKVRLLGGELVDARLGPGCSTALVDECLAARRTVLISEGAILGALQTAPTEARRDVDGNVSVEGGEVVVEADHALSLRAGDTELVLHEDGTVRIVGQRMSIDVAALIKLLSARVELP
jgi:hypothetical protein